MLNIKEVTQKLGAVEEIEGVSERWLLPGRLKNTNVTSVNLTTGAFAVIGDSLKERSIGIGRGISVQPLIDNECYLVQKTANMVKLFDNKTVTFQLDVLEFLSDSNLQSESWIDSIIDIALAGIPT